MILLQEMVESDFAKFKPVMVEEYAGDIARIYHVTIEEARIESTKQLDGFLSHGLATPDHFLFNIISTEEQGDPRVGYLWIKVDAQQKRCFIFDIYLREAFRSRGYGRETLELLESKMRAQNIQRIGLHVFAHNDRARELYSKVGYELTGYNMQKWLD